MDWAIFDWIASSIRYYGAAATWTYLIVAGMLIVEVTTLLLSYVLTALFREKA